MLTTTSLQHYNPGFYLWGRILQTPPSASNLPITESSVSTTSQSSNVTPVTSKRQRSQLTTTSSTKSSNFTNRPPIAEFPILSRSQTSPINTPLVRRPHPEYVEPYVNYKPFTAIKTVRLQPQLPLVHIPDTEFTQVPPLHLTSDISTTSSNTYHNTTSSKLYPPLKPYTKPSTSLSNLLDSSSDYIPSHELTFYSTPSI